MAKQVGLLDDAPFLASGAHHIPMLTSLNYKYYRPSRRTQHCFSREVKQKCLDAFRQDTVYWQQCENGVNCALRSQSTINSLDQIHQILAQGAVHYFKTSKLCRTDASDAFGSHVASKWMHYNKMKQPGMASLPTVFSRWWHFTQFKQLEQDQARRLTELKHQKVQQLTDEAQQAHDRHDSFKLYQVITKHCPKLRTKRIHLKSDDGKFLTPMEETAAYVHYIATNWAGPALSFPSLPPPGVPFTLTELEHAFSMIPATKAVPNCFAPGPFWKSQAPFLATWVYVQLQQWWSTTPPFIPQAWKDAWACWLPKPHKPATSLTNLRMLGLQEPLGKAVLKIVAHKALELSFSKLCSWPQFAYLPYRSTRDALLRASAHCCEVRLLLEAQGRTIHATTRSQPRLPCAGGIQLFLDLTRAFDALPRPVLCDALSRVDLTPQLKSILLAWHIDTRYHVDINNTSRCIPVSRGVRQGCSSAPYLWATTMVLLLDDLQKTIPLSWIRDHVTIYADDLHIFCLFKDEIELQDTLRFFDAVIMAIGRLGLTLSAQKSCILLKGKGAGFFKWKKTAVDMSQKTHPCLKLCNASIRVPIKKQCLYLGTMLSYGDFQRQTVDLRVRAGWNNFRRLQPWLCRKHKITLALRLKLMQTCIVPTICYGIFYTGLTSYGIDLICKTFNMMYRRILGHVPHISRINTRTALTANTIQEPLLTLQQLVEQAHDSMLYALQQVPSHDIIHTTPWTALEHTRSLIFTRLANPVGQSTIPAEGPPLVCGFCSFNTSSPSEMQKHLTLYHSRPRLATTRIDFAQDTAHGMPTCKHCHKSFRTWKGFNMHRRFNVCNVLAQQVTSTLPPIVQDTDIDSMADPTSHADLLARAQVLATEADYDSIMHDRPLCEFMTTHCILCSKHVVSLRGLTAHLRSNHPGQMQEAIALGIQRTRQHTGNLSPCSFCKMEFRRTHLCPVTTQVAVLEMQVSTPDDPRHFTCFLCQFVAQDRLQLRQHLGSRHNFPCFDWIPARDSLPDQVTCAHCGSTHHCLEGLRKHIIYGHCHHFDANKPWTRNGDADLAEHLRLGRVDLLLTQSEVRQRLTLQCQFCTKHFTQACNLINHLFHQHGDIVAEAELFQHVLQQRYAPRGCYCMPPVRCVKTAHQCVAFLQLSMMHYNGNHLLSIPLSYDARACDRMDTHVPLTCLNLVHDCLQNRDFALLQQDPAFRQALCQHCFCCGKQITITGPSQEYLLKHHLQTCHSEPRQIIECLIHMIIYRRQHDHLQQCDWCGQTIVTVDPHTEYDNHLAECPVLLHFATWLSIPFLPLTHGSSTRGHPNADARGPGQSGYGLRGSKRPHAEEKEGSSLKDLFAKQRLTRSRNSQASDADGQPPAPSREGPDGIAVTEQLRSLPVDEQGRHDCTTSTGEHKLEESTAAEPSGDASTPAPVFVPVQDPHSTCHQTEGMQTRGSSLGLQSAVSTGGEGRIMALSCVESQHQAFGDGWQKTQHSHGRDAATTGTDISPAGAASTGDQVSFLAEQNKGSASDPMETRTRHEECQAPSDAQYLSGQLDMAIDLTADQTTSPGTIQDGGRAHEDPETKVNRLPVCLSLMTMALLNDDVQCFVNTVFLTVCWSHLLCSDFTMSSWGSHTGAIIQLLCTGSTTPLGIRQHPLFLAGFQQWSALRSHGQQDYGDFLSFYLGWLSTNLVAQMFQRRYLTDDGVIIAEKSDMHAPILLHSDLWQDQHGAKNFQTLVDRWTQVNGMTSALVIASKLVCVQLCRFQPMTIADRTSFDFGNFSVSLTVFTNDQVATARVPYRIMALVHYTGDSWRGHYTCAVSFTDSLGRSCWLHYDDNRPPTVWYEIPEWFTWNISHVWMVRSDKFLEWHVPPGMMPSSNPDAREAALERVLMGLQ